MPKEFRVFFSHGGEDTYVVESTLKPQMESTGARVFLDSGINFGEDFRALILQELVRCDELLVLFTRSSLLRPWIHAEIGAALVQNKRIVAVRYGTSERELQKLGILSLLGTNNLLHISDFNEYVIQLSSRVEERTHD